MKRIDSLLDIADQFDGLLFDQYGVLHDGFAPYSGVIAALETLVHQEKRIVVITNSGRTAAHNKRKLANLGIPPSLYNRIVTSGDVARTVIREMIAAGTIPANAQTFIIGRGANPGAIDGLPLVETKDASLAEILLITGSEPEAISLSEYREMLERAYGNGAFCICTNPDMLVISKSGNLPGAGAISKIYEKLGSPVHYIGKPHRPVYDEALKSFPNFPNGRICCVGDSVEHDVAGGRGAGIATVLSLTGILADYSENELNAEFAKNRCRPDFVTARLA